MVRTVNVPRCEGSCALSVNLERTTGESSGLSSSRAWRQAFAPATTPRASSARARFDIVNDITTEDGKTGRREDGKTGRREDGRTRRREDAKTGRREPSREQS